MSDPMTAASPAPDGTRVSTMPTGERCPIGSLNAHAYNFERNECIWCGPNRLAWKPGSWVDIGNGFVAWSVDPTPTTTPQEDDR